MIDVSSHSTKSPHCAVVGAGPGNGTAFARKFSKEGYAVALLARRIERLEALARELPRGPARLPAMSPTRCLSSALLPRLQC